MHLLLPIQGPSAASDKTHLQKLIARAGGNRVEMAALPEWMRDVARAADPLIPGDLPVRVKLVHDCRRRLFAEVVSDETV